MFVDQDARTAHAFRDFQFYRCIHFIVIPVRCKINSLFVIGVYLCDGRQRGGHGGGQLLGQSPALLAARRQGEGADGSWPSPGGVVGQTQGRVDGRIAER